MPRVVIEKINYDVKTVSSSSTKSVKSQTFNKNASDLLTGYSNNTHWNSGIVFLTKKSISGALRQNHESKTVDDLTIATVYIQGHMSNFYIVDLENITTASRRYTGDMHNSTVIDLLMTPVRQWKRLERIMVECTCLLHISPP